MFVYLARPIDQSNENSWLDQMDRAIAFKLSMVGYGAFRPYTAYMARIGDASHAQFVDRINTEALRNADALLAILPAGVPTLGTPVEISTALQLNKPTVIITDIESSVQVAAWRNQGATIVDLCDVDTKLPESDDLRQLLLREPNPDWLPILSPVGSDPLFVKYDEGALPLTKAHHTDAGFDLATSEDTTLRTGQRTLIKTGVRTAIPAGWYGRITGRSSALAKWNIQVHEGIIDAGYTGELMLGVTYLGAGHAPVSRGTRLGQLILAPVWDGQIGIVDELPTTLRGENGWGSSGA